MTGGVFADARNVFTFNWDEHILALQKNAALRQSCELLTDRIVSLAGGQSYTTLTDNVLSVDQALARTQQLERKLVQAKVQHVRDVSSLRKEVDLLRTELRNHLTTVGNEAELAFQWSDEDVASLGQRVEEAVKREIGNAAAGVQAQVVEDADLGGLILQLCIWIISSEGAYRELREAALRAFDAVTADIDTRAVVVLVQRRAG